MSANAASKSKTKSAGKSTVRGTSVVNKSRSAKTKNTAKPLRVSALDAAAQVLKASGKPMRAQDLIAAMAEKGLWASPKGKTPSATLYAAMLREITTKGRAARFVKVERGLFAFNKRAE